MTGYARATSAGADKSNTQNEPKGVESLHMKEVLAGDAKQLVRSTVADKSDCSAPLTRAARVPCNRKILTKLDH